MQRTPTDDDIDRADHLRAEAKYTSNGFTVLTARPTLSESELSIIGCAVHGSYYRLEEDADGRVLVFGSNSYPQHRITVREEAAEKYLASVVDSIVVNARAD